MVLAFILIQQSCGPVLDGPGSSKSPHTRFQNERKSRAIATIHRQETISFLGVPVSSYIDIEDSEAVLRAIRLTPDDQPIDLILHTPGGLVLAAEQIAIEDSARGYHASRFRAVWHLLHAPAYEA